MNLHAEGDRVPSFDATLQFPPTVLTSTPPSDFGQTLTLGRGTDFVVAWPARVDGGDATLDVTIVENQAPAGAATLRLVVVVCTFSLATGSGTIPARALDAFRPSATGFDRPIMRINARAARQVQAGSYLVTVEGLAAAFEGFVEFR
jgi:hypothetical protein